MSTPSTVNPFIWTLPAPLASALRASGTTRTYPSGAIIHATGSRSTMVFGLERGRGRMQRSSSQGKALTLTLLYAGSWFGDLGCLLDSVRTDDAVAETTVQLWQVPRAAFDSVLNQRPDFQRLLLRELAGRLQLVLSSFEDSSLSALPRRMAGRLLAMQAAQDHSEGTGLPLPLTQQRLAQMLGVTRENAARVLGRWSQRRWVEGGRGALRLVNPSALQTVADER